MRHSFRNKNYPGKLCYIFVFSSLPSLPLNNLNPLNSFIYYLGNFEESLSYLTSNFFVYILLAKRWSCIINGIICICKIFSIVLIA